MDPSVSEDLTKLFSQSIGNDTASLHHVFELREVERLVTIAHCLFRVRMHLDDESIRSCCHGCDRHIGDHVGVTRSVRRVHDHGQVSFAMEVRDGCQR